MNRQQGFTLIELTVVIVILGILAATALPKFVNLSGDARSAVMRGVEGSMRGANAILYARAATQNQLAAAGSVSVNGTTVNLAYGYASDGTELGKVMDLSPAADFTVAAADIRHAGATTPANCSVTYTAATSANNPPVYALDVSGC